jgi:hypothetical protein
MSKLNALSFRIVGTAPFLMHNGNLADPLDPHAKRMASISGKRRKTEADHARLAQLEFLGSLYLRDGKPCIPAEMIEAAIVRGAAQNRRGLKARAGIVVTENILLKYSGPTDPSALWENQAFQLRCPVRVGATRIMRTRPMFKEWAAELQVEFMPGLLNPQDVQHFLTIAGEQIGIGDWRPRFGRFRVEEQAG